MPIYLYKARDQEGLLLKGRLEADDGYDLRRKIEGKGLFLISFSPERKILNLNLSLGFSSVSGHELFSFTIQLAHTLSSGVSILSALSFVIDECRNQRFKQILEKVYDDLKSGSSLSEAFVRHPQVFSPLFISMVETGESSGNLSQILYKLANYFKRGMEIRRKTITSMIYPIILSIVTFSIITLLLTFIVPKFVDLFIKENVPLPTPTVVLLAISKLLKFHWPLLFLVIIGAVVFFRTLYSIPKARLIIDREKMNLPVLGNIVRKVNIYRFIDSLAILYVSGLPIVKAMDNIERILQNKYFANMIKDLRGYIIKGGDISQHLRNTGLFPSDVVGMVRSGEESGTLGDVLTKIAEIYHQEINENIDRLLALIEPILILFTGLTIGFIALAMLLPVFRLTRLISR